MGKGVKGQEEGKDVLGNDDEGALVGSPLGKAVGVSVDGMTVGCWDWGPEDGAFVGEALGYVVGETVGSVVEGEGVGV